MPGSAHSTSCRCGHCFSLFSPATYCSLNAVSALDRGGRDGRRKKATRPVSAIVASELGLLAFMLAFSFGIVVSPFDLRRNSMLNEANAIGTTYLRAEMLPAAQSGPIRQLLRDYVDVRLQATNGMPINQVLHRSEEIQQQLWAQAVVAAERTRDRTTITHHSAMSAVRFEDQRADLRPVWPVLTRSAKAENKG